MADDQTEDEHPRVESGKPLPEFLARRQQPEQAVKHERETPEPLPPALVKHVRPPQTFRANDATEGENAGVESGKPLFPPFVQQARPPEQNTVSRFDQGCMLVIGNGLSTILGGVAGAVVAAQTSRPQGDGIFPPALINGVIGFFVGMVLGPALFSLIWFSAVTNRSEPPDNNRKD